ncbi:MAG: putative CXXCH cytochrome family protein, partial [Bacteroidia bacterium]
MHYLIRTHTGRGQQEAFDAEYEAKQLSLGSSGNETVQLPGLPGQTKFSPDGDGGATLSTKGLKATVDGNATSKAKVAIGDEIKLPGYALTVIAAPQGFDFALEIESEGVSYAGGMDLSERLGSMRRTSWIGALLVLVLMLIIPSLVLFGPDTANQVRSLPLPDDGLWSSGPLLGAHDTAGLAENCQACHETPFTMVKDNACLDCHRNITEHVDIGIHGIEGFSDERCASCHREHNEPATLMRSDNGLCVDCHAEPERFDGKEHGMQAATAFTSEDHPHFRLDLQIPMGPGGAHGWEVKAVRQDTPGLQEQSGLKFNHDVHLDVDKVQEGDSGDALQCASCHALEDDGEHFAPITMDNDCRSCHELTFDMFEPDLELPHGDTRAAIVAMEAHFIREFTDPLLRKQRAGEKPRRIPGKRDDAATCEGTGLDCGRAEALKEAGFQFADT